MKITLKLLNDLCKENNIPETATLQSDSGWECCETDCYSVYYNPKENKIILHGENNGLDHREGCIQLFSDDNYVEDVCDIWRYYVDDQTKYVMKERISKDD
jgi:hypothetical protein